MISGNTGLQRGKDKNLLVAADLENGAAAVPHVKVLIVIKGHAGGDAHAFGVDGTPPVGSGPRHLLEPRTRGVLVGPVSILRSTK